MNKVEKFVYDIVKANPRLKLAIRNVYQKTFDVLPTPKPLSDLPIVSREGYFFGFHDHTPFSADNARLLANHYTIPLRMPKLGEKLEVGFFQGEDFEEFVPVSDTHTWMWHLGCKLQWRGRSNEIVFNDHSDGTNIARIINVDTKAEKILPDSIGSVSPDGKWAVGYSFARVAKCMPGYGYDYDVGDTELNSLTPKRHGLHILNIENGIKKTLFSIDDIAQHKSESSMKGAMHFFTHTVFSPNSKRFIFLHRWINGDVTKRWSRMISCDVDGNDIYIFPTVDMVSHIGWRDDEHVIAYCRIKGFDDQYVLFKDMDDTDFNVVGLGQFNSDGHPSFDSSKRWMVTDTYPDRRRVQRLVLFDMQKNQRIDVAKLPMPKEYQTPEPYSHWACDLHPRWDRSSHYICFDATYTGTRSLCTVNINKFLEANC